MALVVVVDARSSSMIAILIIFFQLVRKITVHCYGRGHPPLRWRIQVCERQQHRSCRARAKNRQQEKWLSIPCLVVLRLITSTTAELSQWNTTVEACHALPPSSIRKNSLDLSASGKERHGTWNQRPFQCVPQPQLPDALDNTSKSG